MNDFRIFVLGAGFSVPAGLPSADDLWQEVLRRLQQIDWLEAELADELEIYRKFRISRGEDTESDPFDFEDFLSFLDIEHSLGFKGSKQFSSEGNEIQLALKWIISQVIVERTPRADALPACYIEFAEALQLHDSVITFNYDTVLETALDAIGKRYRLVPFRYVERQNGILDLSREEEVVIVKLHGSIDWFDRTQYARQEAFFREKGMDGAPDDVVFGPNSVVVLDRVAQDPQPKDELLSAVYRVKERLRELYLLEPPLSISPLLLAPSSVKIVYAGKLRSLFWGLGRIGAFNLGLVIIGYSIPRNDDHARQLLLRLVSNYQDVNWDSGFSGQIKKPTLLIDFRQTLDSRTEYAESYSFCASEKTIFFLDGFESRAVKLIVAET